MNKLRKYLVGCKNTFRSLPNPDWYVEKQKALPQKTLKYRILKIKNGLQMYADTWKPVFRRNESETEANVSGKYSDIAHDIHTDVQRKVEYIKIAGKEHLEKRRELIIDTSKDIKMPPQKTMENSFRSWLQVLGVCRDEFLNGFQEGKEEIETDTNAISWFNHVFENINDVASTVGRDIQDPSFSRNDLVEKYGGNLKKNLSELGKLRK
jgi:hypothetical protein